MEREADRGRDAEKPIDISPRGWLDIGARVWRQLGEDNLGIVAAGLAFYGILALFPALIATVSLYALVASPDAIRDQLGQLTTLIPTGGADLIEAQLAEIVRDRDDLSWGVVLGLAAALWTASTGTHSLLSGVNIAFNEKETRGWFRLRGLALLLTVGWIVFALTAFGVIAVLPIALDYVGLGDFTRAALEWGRWPLLAVMVVLGLSVIYRYAPDRRDARWRWVSLGSVVATVLWLAASAGFSWYVQAFGRYNETYGALGAVIVLLLWLFISGYVVLLGAEVNAETEHQTLVDSTVGDPRPMGERGAHVADTRGPSVDELHDDDENNEKDDRTVG